MTRLPVSEATADLVAAWFKAGHTGAGTPWLSVGEAEALARYALMKGEGVRMMEGAAYSFHEPPRDTDWEILGADPAGANWEDHRDPARAFALFQRKLQKALQDGARLKYKLWLAKP